MANNWWSSCTDGPNKFGGWHDQTDVGLHWVVPKEHSNQSTYVTSDDNVIWKTWISWAFESLTFAVAIASKDWSHQNLSNNQKQTYRLKETKKKKKKKKKEKKKKKKKKEKEKEKEKKKKQKKKRFSQRQPRRTYRLHHWHSPDVWCSRASIRGAVVEVKASTVANFPNLG